MLKNYWDRNSGKIVVVYSILLTLVLVIPVPVIPEPRMGKVGPKIQFDKIVHLALFAMYSLVWMKFLLRHRRAPTVKALVISLCFALFTEALQGVIPYRGAKISDLFADFVGIILGLLFAKSFLAKRDRGSPQFDS